MSFFCFKTLQTLFKKDFSSSKGGIPYCFYCIRDLSTHFKKIKKRKPFFYFICIEQKMMMMIAIVCGNCFIQGKGVGALNHVWENTLMPGVHMHPCYLHFYENVQFFLYLYMEGAQVIFHSFMPGIHAMHPCLSYFKENIQLLFL